MLFVSSPTAPAGQSHSFAFVGLCKLLDFGNTLVRPLVKTLATTGHTEANTSSVRNSSQTGYGGSSYSPSVLGNLQLILAQ